jgi:hypothetical protein
MMNFDRPDQQAGDVSAATAYTLAHVRTADPDFADRIEGAWRVMESLPADVRLSKARGE